MLRRLCLTALAVTLWAAARAEATSPCKINFTLRFDIETPEDDLYRNLAPWYTYFPYDPRSQHHHAPPPYPSWPATWPPAPTPVPTSRPTPTPINAPRGWQTVSHQYAVPVSYQYAVPYYWYQR